MTKIIEQTPDYDMMLGEVEGETVYVIKNRVYGVVETSTALLPQAYEYLTQIQSALDVRRGELEDDGTMTESVEDSTDGVVHN